MNNIDRRNLLIGSGLALGLAGCHDKEKTTNEECYQKFSMLSASLGENHGNIANKPILPIANGTDAKFNSRHIAILHLEFTEVSGIFKLYGKRIHFDNPETTSGGDLSDHMTLISKVISNVNLGVQDSSLPDLKFIHGIKGLSFNGPQHFVIYIRNNGVNFADNPIIFAKKLLDGTDAKENGSFFYAHPYTADTRYPIQEGSQQFLHMKNYFRKFTSMTNVGDEIGKTEKLYYGMNIIATIASSGEAFSIPVIIDPDTGNMGTGGGDG